MSEQEVLAIIIGRTVVLFPKEVAEMLNKNAVVVDAENYDVSQSIEAVTNGLVSSESFRNDFTSFVEANKESI